MAKRKRRPLAPLPKPTKAGDRKLFATVAAIAAGLGAIVWWSLPGDHPAATPGDQDAASQAADDLENLEKEAEDAAGIPLERPAGATATFAVISRKPDDVVRQVATVSEIEKRLGARHCGDADACRAVHKFMSMEDAFAIDIVKTDDLILPPKDTMVVVAPGLTPHERDEARQRPTAVRVRTMGPWSRDQVPARAAFAAAAVLAEALDAFVYDEVSRRLETTPEFMSHTITAPLGKPAFAPRQIVVQLYRTDDGTARMLTLGMARYGSPDLSIREANLSSGPLLGEVLNAAASKIAFDATDANLTITLDDIARVSGRKPSELNPNPEHALPVVELSVLDAERQPGDADNTIAELVPWGGSTRENWDGVLRTLFGQTPSVNQPVDDAELTKVAENAKKTLPDAIKRFEGGGGELFVKGPFAIPPDSRVDGGATTELLWVQAASCDDRRCTGSLSNDPSYATNLAAGKTTSVERTEAVDWMIRQRDGGIAGGESIRVLKSRMK
jgi:uncharacterized protein YegJ (DUF2314 family)